MRLHPSDASSSQKQVARVFFVDLPHQKNRDVRRKESDAHFRISECGFGDRESEIAKGGDAASARDCRPVDCRNRRLWNTTDSPQKPGELARVLQIFFRGLRSNR